MSILRNKKVELLACSMLGIFMSMTSVFAGDYSSSAIGTSSGKFLSFGTSARAAAMGEAYSATTKEADAVRYNPAALVRVESNSVEIMHADYLADTFFDQVAFARRIKSNQAIGFSILQMSYGDIDKTDIAGAPIGAAHPSNLALTGAYAYKLDNLSGFLNESSLGLSVSYIQSTIVSSAKTFTASLGLLSPAYGPYKIQIAIVMDNLFGKLKFDQEADSLPLSFKLGSIAHIQEDWILALDCISPKDNAPYMALGTEMWIKKRETMGVAIRAGYNMLTSQDLEGLSGFATGLGISLHNTTIDYSFAPFGDLGAAHRITLALKFGKERHTDFQKKYTKAKFEKVEKEEPLNPSEQLNTENTEEASYDGYIENAENYLMQKDYENAFIEYGNASETLDKEDKRQIDILERMGLILLKQKNYLRSEKFYYASIKTAKTLDITDEIVVSAYLGLAYCQKKRGKTDWAIINYKTALKLTKNPNTKLRIEKTLNNLNNSH